MGKCCERFFVYGRIQPIFGRTVYNDMHYRRADHIMYGDGSDAGGALLLCGESSQRLGRFGMEQ